MTFPAEWRLQLVSFLLMELVRGLLVLGVYVVTRYVSGQKADRLLMNTMECGSYGVANSSKVRCHVYRNLTLVICQLNPICTLIFYLYMKHFSIVFSCMAPGIA